MEPPDLAKLIARAPPELDARFEVDGVHVNLAVTRMGFVLEFVRALRFFGGLVVATLLLLPLYAGLSLLMGPLGIVLSALLFGGVVLAGVAMMVRVQREDVVIGHEELVIRDWKAPLEALDIDFRPGGGNERSRLRLTHDGVTWEVHGAFLAEEHASVAWLRDLLRHMRFWRGALPREAAGEAPEALQALRGKVGEGDGA